MFLFKSIPWYADLMSLVVLGGLIFVNEITHRSKRLAICVCIVLPLVMTFTVWLKTAGPDTPMGYWVPCVKTYSALAGVVGFMALRYLKKLGEKNVT